MTPATFGQVFCYFQASPLHYLHKFAILPVGSRFHSDDLINSNQYFIIDTLHLIFMWLYRCRAVSSEKLLKIDRRDCFLYAVNFISSLKIFGIDDFEISRTLQFFVHSYGNYSSLVSSPLQQFARYDLIVSYQALGCQR